MGKVDTILAGFGKIDDDLFDEFPEMEESEAEHERITK